MTSPSPVATENQFLFTSETGVAFRAIYLQQTETSGYSGSLVQFYDTGFPVERYGQYVSGYYVSTLLDDYGALCQRGLCLDGRVSTWSIDPASMRSVLDWLKTKPVERSRVAETPVNKRKPDAGPWPAPFAEDQFQTAE